MTEDTVVDFDDMAHSVPRRSLRASVAKMKFISLHQSHVYREEGEFTTSLLLHALAKKAA